MEKFKDVVDAHLAVELEQVVAEANKHAIRAALGSITRKELEASIHFVAAVRARYLMTVKKLAHPEKVAGKPDERAKLFAQLREERLAYEEALGAFNALKHALAQRYLKIDE
ncbi:MAG: hypothetical protein RIM72_06245 [Alphaproteobacteria bacterium]